MSTRDPEWYTKEAQEERAERGRRTLGRGSLRPPTGALTDRADEEIREARKHSAALGRGRKAPGGRGDWTAAEIRYVHGDLKISSEGRKLGRRFNHDAYALARSLGVAIQYVPLGLLQEGAPPGITITGRIWRLPGQPPFVQLGDTLREPEASRTLGHEIGHYLDFDNERHCDQFAAAFLEVRDEELPGHAWRQIQDDLERRARRASIVQARVLAAASRY